MWGRRKKGPLPRLETVDFLIEQCNSPLRRVYTLSRKGEGRVWDLNTQRIFCALRLKILMPGAKNRRQALRSHTPALSHPGEGVNLLVSAFARRVTKSTVSSVVGEGRVRVLVHFKHLIRRRTAGFGLNAEPL